LSHDLATIYREADRAAQVVRNLLAFAGARPVVRSPLNIAALLDQIVDQRQSSSRAQNIEIVRHYGEKLLRVRGDALLLHQVLLNVIRNAEQAVAATGRPGRIDITARSGARGQIVVTVRDSGEGIPIDVMSRLFEPFYTTRDVGKGTGLGLAIAYGVLQDHGGHISAANHPDGGAMLTVELPSEPPS
jgi:signal transduction histidine kinase